MGNAAVFTDLGPTVGKSVNWTSGTRTISAIDGLTDYVSSSSEMTHLVVRHITGIATKYDFCCRQQKS
jgi:hypothetical protein